MRNILGMIFMQLVRHCATSVRGVRMRVGKRHTLGAIR